MTAAVREWLPPGALTPRRLQVALQDVVAEWGSFWFFRGAVSLEVRRDRSRARALSPEQLQVEGQQVSATLPGRGKRHLLEAALGEELGNRSLSPADHQLLDAFSRRVIEDLVVRIDTVLDGPQPDQGAIVELGASLDGNDICSIHCAEEVLVPLIRTQFGRPADNRPPPKERMAALGPVQLEVEGVLGRVDLAVDDLEGLAIGDVLILDRSLHAPVELCMSGAGPRLGRGRLGRDGDRCTITF